MRSVWVVVLDGNARPPRLSTRADLHYYLDLVCVRVAALRTPPLVSGFREAARKKNLEEMMGSSVLRFLDFGSSVFQLHIHPSKIARFIEH